MITLFILLLLRHFGVAVSTTAIVWSCVLLGLSCVLALIPALNKTPRRSGFWIRWSESSWICLRTMVFVIAGTSLTLPSWSWVAVSITCVLSTSISTAIGVQEKRAA